MNERIKLLAEQATNDVKDEFDHWINSEFNKEKFAELIVRECIDKIETHRIPVGNSAAGEMACEWTYAALKEIRDEIKQHFGVEE
jgi:pyrrolidone-carboxylate peptidase